MSLPRGRLAALSLGASACIAAGLVGCAGQTAVAGPSPATTAALQTVTAPGARTGAGVTVVTSGLAQPKKITIGPGGSLIVAVAGDGGAPHSCADGRQPSCLDRSGAVVEISPGGQVQTLLSGLASVSSGSSAGVATGPAQARLASGGLEVLFGDAAINPGTGRQPYGPGGSLLGDLVRFSAAGVTHRASAAFGPFEASHNPNHDAGTDVARHVEPGVDSNPYAFVAYRGGYAVADAGADDVLYVSRTGRISVLAVLPTIREKAPPGTFGSAQTGTITALSQPVPDSVAVGPDGALYVGELGGEPFGLGKSSVYRVVPGRAPTVYATGFTSIGDIAFDRSGRLLVLEIDRKGLNDPALKAVGRPAPGAIIRVSANGTRSLVASAGLEFPTGMAVARDGTVYVSTNGIASGTGGSDGTGGEIVKVSLR